MSNSSPFSTDPEKIAEKAKLRYTTDDKPGYMRLKKGKEFTYYDTEGKVIRDKNKIERINKLGIPPAWRDVWVCASGNGHLQATGRDEKGRKQYIYHERWNEVRNQNKFNKMLFFGEVLPDLRRAVRLDMSDAKLTRDRVVATIVWLLENTLIRVGNEEYAKENDSFGLTTMRRKHVDVRGNRITFEFKGKSGIYHDIDVSHPRVAKTIRKLEELPGYELFQFIDEDGNRHTVASDDVNEYLKKITGEEVTAKDFRTWGGSVLSAETLCLLGDCDTKTATEKNIKEAVKKVAQHLGNTPTVCRHYYIHPVVPESYIKKLLIPHFDEVKKSAKAKKSKLAPYEYGFYLLLKN